MRPIVIFAAIIALFGAMGCAVNPVTGKRELSIIPASQEISIGTQNYLPYQEQQGADFAG